MKIFNFLNTFFWYHYSHLLMILHWIVIIHKESWSFGVCWPLLAFIGLFGLCGLGWFFKAKTGLCWYKLSIIDLFPTIRCQNQSPNEIGHFESLWGTIQCRILFLKGNTLTRLLTFFIIKNNKKYSYKIHNTYV